jgi:DNA-nicking Smr family endonuclease
VATFRRRGLTEHDRAAWADYARHVARLPGRDAPEAPAVVTVPAPPSPSWRETTPGPPRAAAPRLPPPLVVGRQPAGLDNATWNRFRTGRIAAARTLDLHGRTAQRAFHSLEAFLHRAHSDRLRCVEVITGRGSGENGGVIRREFPIWLNLGPLRPIVLAAAHPHPGNVGAVRLLLRRAGRGGGEA